MIDSEVLQLTQQALWLVLIIAGPPVLVVAVVGLLIAFFQAATQLQEQTFQYAAKFVAMILTIFLTASFMGTSLYQFSDRIFTIFPTLVGS